MLQAEEDLLVLAAQDGNHKAFHMIFQQYQKPLLRYAFKVCGDKEISQDAVQEAWIKFAGTIRKLDDPRALRSWLYKLVHWRIVDLVRAEHNHRKSEQVFEDEKHDCAIEETQTRNESLNIAIDCLPSIEKQVIHLFYLHELKVNEIAMVLRIPAGTVKSRLNRARKMLKEKYKV